MFSEEEESLHYLVESRNVAQEASHCILGLRCIMQLKAVGVLMFSVGTHHHLKTSNSDSDAHLRYIEEHFLLLTVCLKHAKGGR